ncbi:MAG: hypothetical protein CBC91_07250 [Rickettsiales bacterium TMED131]|mgnify:CR=1 FL=1|nr:MAG: hypothetical protein CBC91_07250 [Rickettsiales bacterium TMED131]
MRIYKEEYKRYLTKTQERHYLVRKIKRLQRMIGDVHLISAYLGDFFRKTRKKMQNYLQSAIDKRQYTCHNILVNMKREREKTLWV